MTSIHLRTRLCELLDINYPICLAGMGSQGRATPPALVAAVSEAGGLGVIGGAGLSAARLRAVIREVRALTAKPIGVNLVLPQAAAKAELDRDRIRKEILNQFPEHAAFVRDLAKGFGLELVELDSRIAVSGAATADGTDAGLRGSRAQLTRSLIDVVLEENVQVFAGAVGDLKLISGPAHEKRMLVMGLATSTKQAKSYAVAGADLIIAQGLEAGGHVGRVPNFALLPDVIDSVPVPVIAAGGISDGRGIAASLAFGAVGVWMGTAFLVAEECNIPAEHKSQILEGRLEDFRSDRIYSGSPMRGFRNATIKAWEDSGLEPLANPYQKVLMDDFNAAAAAAGRWDLHSNPSGVGGGLLTKARPAREIVDDLVRGASESISRLAGSI